MTLKEANAILDAAPKSDKLSRINVAFTQAQAIEIVRKGINSGKWKDDEQIDELLAKRVLQVSKNKIRV